MARVGSQTPRVMYLPENGVRDAAREVTALGMLVGVRTRPWQINIAKAVTAKRADGKFSCFEFGLELPRQNGKTAIIELVMLWHLFLVKETRLIVYSAHEFKTAEQTFQRMVRLIQNSPLEAQVGDHGIRYGNDDKSITTLDGSKIQFMSRTGGAGRGFTGDLIVLDEAYNLSAAMIAAIMPTLTTAHNPQMIYLSSAGFLTSEYLNGLRRRALSDEPGNLGWMEWSARKGADPDDIENAYISNPMLGDLFDEEYVRNELAAFRSDPQLGETAWLRERYGVRESLGGSWVIDPDHWKKLVGPRPYGSPEEFPSISLAVDVPPSRDSAAIGMAAYAPDGRIFADVVDHRDGTSWVPGYLRDLKDRANVRVIGIDEGAPAGGLVTSLRREARLRHHPITLKKYAAACGRFFDLATGPERQLFHADEPTLNAALEAARKTKRTELAWTWSRKDSVSDISPLVAVTNAVSLLGKPPAGDAGPPKKRRALVMR